MTSKPYSAPPTAAPPRPATLPPPAWINARNAHLQLWTRLAQGAPALLICDYDGTLAPFKADKMLATPYPGIAERLETIAALRGCTLALVSGRPVSELLTQEVVPQVQESLDAAAAELAGEGYASALERKSGSLAAHWRNLSPTEQAAFGGQAQRVFAKHTAAGALAILPFESGLELRASDQTKAHAVEALLAAQLGASPVAAYLGDDLTDEDAFGALGERGLSLLVRDEPRPSLAQYWLRPPAQLIGFLDDWARAASRGGDERSK